MIWSLYGALCSAVLFLLFVWKSHPNWAGVKLKCLVCTCRVFWRGYGVTCQMNSQGYSCQIKFTETVLHLLSPRHESFHYSCSWISTSTDLNSAFEDCDQDRLYFVLEAVPIERLQGIPRMKESKVAMANVLVMLCVNGS